jgi:hypothetical protein
VEFVPCFIISTMNQPASSSSVQGPPRRLYGLLLVAGMVILGLVVAALVLQRRSGDLSTARHQLEQFRQLGAALQQYAGEHGNMLPEQITPELNLRDAAGRPLDIAAILNDSATGQPVAYRVVTAAGERIGFEQYGERVIAWTGPNYRAQRAVLFNGMDARFLPDSTLDLTQQRSLLGESLNRVQSMEAADEEED